MFKLNAFASHRTSIVVANQPRSSYKNSGLSTKQNIQMREFFSNNASSAQPSTVLRGCTRELQHAVEGNLSKFVDSVKISLAPMTLATPIRMPVSVPVGMRGGITTHIVHERVEENVVTKSPSALKTFFLNRVNSFINFLFAKKKTAQVAPMEEKTIVIQLAEITMPIINR